MVMPYLQFEGGCEEAFALYARVFGGEVLHLSRYTGATGGPALAGKVMHAFVSFGDKGGLNGADGPGPVTQGNAMQLIAHFDRVEEAETAMALLSEGGSTLRPLTPHPPPDDGGMDALVKDRFGYSWIITAPNPAKT